MNEWSIKTLRDVSTNINYGYTASATDVDTGVKFLRITDIVNQPFDWSSVPYCEISKRDAIKYKLEKGDIVIARTGATTGTTFIYEDNVEAVFASYLIRYSINTDLANPKFISYQLKSDNWRGFVDNIIGGSAQPGANANQFTSYEFALPPLPEQQAIAEVLSSLDDKIDLLHQNNKTLEELAEMLFHSKFIVDADDNWETNTLGELFDIGIGRTPPRKESKWFSNCPDDVKWASIKDMGNSGVYLLTTAETLTQQAVEQFNIPVVPPNTALLSFKMTLGRVGITSECMVTNEAIAHFKPKPHTYMFTEFIYLYLKTYKWERLGSTSSIVDAINSRMIKDIEITVPSDSTLLEFRNQIQPLFEKVKRNQEQILCLQSMRNLLLPKLMSGAIRVKDFTHELSVL